MIKRIGYHFYRRSCLPWANLPAVPGPPSDELKQLNSQLQDLYRQGKYYEAIPLAEKFSR